MGRKITSTQWSSQLKCNFTEVENRKGSHFTVHLSLFNGWRCRLFRGSSPYWNNVGSSEILCRRYVGCLKGSKWFCVVKFVLLYFVSAEISCSAAMWYRWNILIVESQYGTTKIFCDVTKGYHYVCGHCGTPSRTEIMAKRFMLVFILLLGKINKLPGLL